MSRESILRQAYRGYGVAAVVWAGWSIAWIGTDLQMDPAAVGYGWLAIALVGAVVGVSMVSMRASDDYRLFRTRRNRTQIRRFENHSLGGTPLLAYALGLVAWSAVTVAWVTGVGGIELGTAVVGYGWVAVALYGAGLTVGLAVKHKRELVDAVDEVTSTAVGKAP